jgi:hypothetical protein
VGSQWVLRTPEQVEAFRRDWALGMPLREMAALHGYRNHNSVTRAAKRLGLPRRPGGPERRGLEGGRWVLDPARRVQVWVEDGAA